MIELYESLRNVYQFFVRHEHLQNRYQKIVSYFVKEKNNFSKSFLRRIRCIIIHRISIQPISRESMEMQLFLCKLKSADYRSYFLKNSRWIKIQRVDRLFYCGERRLVFFGMVTIQFLFKSTFCTIRVSDNVPPHP